MIKKVLLFLVLIFLISGCAQLPSKEPGTEPSNQTSGQLLRTIEVDSGSSANIVTDNSNIYVIYVKENDIYTKKYYMDFKPIELKSFDTKTFEAQPARVTRSANIEEVALGDFNNYIFRMNYLTIGNQYYYAESYRDFGLMNKKQKDSADLKLMSTLELDNVTYKVSTKDGKVIVKEYSK